MKFRSVNRAERETYEVLRATNDVKAVASGSPRKIARRVVRRAAGRAMGRWL